MTTMNNEELVRAKAAVQDLLPLLNADEAEFVDTALDRSLQRLRERLTDWAANHALADVRAEAQNALDALDEVES